MLQSADDVVFSDKAIIEIATAHQMAYHTERFLNRGYHLFLEYLRHTIKEGKITKVKSEKQTIRDKARYNLIGEILVNMWGVPHHYLGVRYLRRAIAEGKIVAYPKNLRGRHRATKYYSVADRVNL